MGFADGRTFDMPSLVATNAGLKVPRRMSLLKVLAGVGCLIPDRFGCEKEGIVAFRRLWVAILFLAVACWSGPVLAVEYMLEFEGLWEGAHVEGGTLPSGEHFTTLIGATHDAGDPLWTSGGMATTGIENVAEQGSTAALAGEIQARITAGTAGEQITVPGINSFPTTTQATFEIEIDDPNVSLISMVAPTPDWFVGVSDLSLRNGNLWVQTLTVDLHPYDAGTEQGSGFSLSNPATVPQEPIALIDGSPFVGSPVIGRLHFTLLTPQPSLVPMLSNWALFLLGGSLATGLGFVTRWRPSDHFSDDRTEDQ